MAMASKKEGEEEKKFATVIWNEIARQGSQRKKNLLKSYGWW